MLRRFTRVQTPSSYAEHQRTGLPCCPTLAESLQYVERKRGRCDRVELKWRRLWIVPAQV